MSASTDAPTSVIYECPDCETRYLDERRCPDCNLFTRRIGPGGSCPHCDEPDAQADLTRPPPNQGDRDAPHLTERCLWPLSGQIPWPPPGSFHVRHWAVPTGH